MGVMLNPEGSPVAGEGYDVPGPLYCSSIPPYLRISLELEESVKHSAKALSSLAHKMRNALAERKSPA